MTPEQIQAKLRWYASRSRAKTEAKDDPLYFEDHFTWTRRDSCTRRYNDHQITVYRHYGRWAYAWRHIPSGDSHHYEAEFKTAQAAIESARFEFCGF